MLSALYGSLAAQRRRWYQRRPEARRRLSQPVVSVGALTVGGSGKTPVVAHLAELLQTMGERPAVLSRGYGRARRVDGVVVVRDPHRIRADLHTAGDEPLMLARRLAGVSVLVSDDRYLAGRLAETQLEASVHLLDDGFQHLPLERDIDLVVVGKGDADERHTPPGGRLREPLGAARLADALMVDTTSADAAKEAARLGVGEAFRVTRRLQSPRDATSGSDAEAVVVPGARVLAVAGIARPSSFVDDLRESGYEVAASVEVPDHHAYSAQEVGDICRRAESLGVDWVMTTEKDLVRLLPFAPFGFPLASVPLTIEIAPADRFGAWLFDRVATARAVGASRPGTGNR